MHCDSCPPRRTGLADFPHPALLKTVTRHQPYGPATQPSLWRRAESVVGSAESSVVGPAALLWSKRLSFRLTQCTSSVPPLRSTPITELLRYYGRLRFPSRASDWVMSSPAALRSPRNRSYATAPAWASQVPELISQRALSPYTPESLVVATPVAGRPVAGFSSSGRLATLTCLSRPNSGFTGVTARVVTAPGFASRITPTYAGLATC